MSKFFIDLEFIEGFHKPLLGKRRHFIDVISIGMVSDDNRTFHFISSEYDFKKADRWVRNNVITPLYLDTVHGDRRNYCDVHNFHKAFGVPNDKIAQEILAWIYPETIRGIGRSNMDEFVKRSKEYGWRSEPIEFYGYYADYDWVLFCSLFGRMIDLPKGFPMYCRDLKQMMDEKGVDSKHPDCPKQHNEHNAVCDAVWNKAVYDWLKTL